MVLGSLSLRGLHVALIYPLALGGVSIIASIIGIAFIKLSKGSVNIMGGLYKGLIAAGVISAILFYPVTTKLFAGTSLDAMKVYLAALIGLVVTGLLVVITDYYTSKSFAPVKTIAAASETGHGTNVIAGLAVAMQSTAAPVLVIVAATLGAYSLVGLYGVAVARWYALACRHHRNDRCLRLITDNAGGIAEMAGLDESVRKVTDSLDAVGSTTRP